MSKVNIKNYSDLEIYMYGTWRYTIIRLLSKDDPQQRQPDNTLAKQHFGWEPKIKLDEGLQTTMEWFAENLNLTVNA